MDGIDDFVLALKNLKNIQVQAVDDFVLAMKNMQEQATLTPYGQISLFQQTSTGKTISDQDGIAVTRGALKCIMNQVIDIVMQKNADYGNAWQRDGAPGWATRLKDKLCRIEVLMDGREALVVDEHIKDTLMDAIGYSLLGLLYLEATDG